MTAQVCDMCRRQLRSGTGVVDFVRGEYEGDGMAAHGSLGRVHEKCWNIIVRSLKFYKVALLEEAL